MRDLANGNDNAMDMNIAVDSTCINKDGDEIHNGSQNAQEIKTPIVLMRAIDTIIRRCLTLQIME
jgi:hypothetical protein